MDQGAKPWLATTACLAVWAAISSMALLPFALLVVSMACAAHAPTRQVVGNWLVGLFSYGFVRGCLIVLAGAMFIQFLPLELALFAAADILAYVEVAAAMTLIAANVRLKALRGVVVRRWQAVRVRIVRRVGRAIRVIRTRPVRPRASDDPDGWAFA